MCAITLCSLSEVFARACWVQADTSSIYSEFSQLHYIAFTWDSRKSKKETWICSVDLHHSSHRVSFSKALHARENKFDHSNLTFWSSTNPCSRCHLGATACVIILTNFTPACSGTSKTSGQFLEAVTWVTSKHEALCRGMGVGELAKLAWKQEIPSSDFSP